MDPGQTATEFTGHIGQSVEEGAEAAVRIAALGPDPPRGRRTTRYPGIIHDFFVLNALRDTDAVQAAITLHTA
ncbi:hypothetical protein ACIRD8_35575 [Streptomyces sp. NPDC102451]|uniref:hypothetical protein n=1 Tax=Streptomyces sp. NPDC102451 TaxID=3366177 RepID=UPI0037FC7897